MSNILPTSRYYPKLSEIVTVEDLPDFLSFVEDGLNTIFDSIHYKNLQFSKSYHGDSAFYSLEIVSRKKLAIPLPFDMALVLNPDHTDNSISSFPITVEYQWEILAFLKSFSLQSFSFSLEDFYDLGLKVFRITDEQVLANISNLFVETENVTNSVDQLVSEINSYLEDVYPGTPLLVVPENVSLSELTNELKSLEHSIGMLMFAIYILDSDLDTTKKNLEVFFKSMVPEGIEEYIKKLIIPKAKATLALSAGIEFPNNLLKPVTPEGVQVSGNVIFVFAEAQLYVDTEKGVGFEIELEGNLLPTGFAEIGKSGILIQIESLKLDLSKKTNIIEADLDGRPADFTGVYARAVSVTLPARWFHEDNEEQQSFTSTLRLGGYDLLIGTGGISGTIIIETVPVVNNGEVTNYFEDFFELNYPVTLIKKDSTTGKILEIEVFNELQLQSALSPGVDDAGIAIPPYTFKFPLSLMHEVEKTVKLTTQFQFKLTTSFG